MGQKQSFGSIRLGGATTVLVIRSLTGQSAPACECASMGQTGSFGGRLMRHRDGLLTLARLRELVDQGTVDTVLVAMTDMQGRLQGKRCAAEYFLNEVIPHATEACNYLLAVDV